VNDGASLGWRFLEFYMGAGGTAATAVLFHDASSRCIAVRGCRTSDATNGQWLLDVGFKDLNSGAERSVRMATNVVPSQTDEFCETCEEWWQISMGGSALVQ
jgi:hypothetical protein